MKFNKYFLLHFVVLLWGFTPVLGKLISLQALDLVWWRVIFSIPSLYIFMRYKGITAKVTLKELIVFVPWGFMVGLHWYLFYHAIKISNVSIALAGFSSSTLFGSFIQPILLKKKFFIGDLIFGVVIMLGLLIIFNAETLFGMGILFGILAALSGALFSVYNGKLILAYPAEKIVFYELIGALVLISVLVWADPGSTISMPQSSDLIYLLLLSVFCTTLAFTLGVEIMKQFTPFAVILTNNLEPIYGIVFSLLIFGESEYMSKGFYVGAVIILIGVFTYPLIKKRFTEAE